jgi:hypothetical protein
MRSVVQTGLTTLTISGYLTLDYPKNGGLTHLTTLGCPSENGTDRFDYSFDGWLTHLTTLGYPWMLCFDPLDYPSDGWLAGLTTLVILRCYALTHLTTHHMVG